MCKKEGQCDWKIASDGSLGDEFTVIWRGLLGHSEELGLYSQCGSSGQEHIALVSAWRTDPGHLLFLASSFLSSCTQVFSQTHSQPFPAWVPRSSRQKRRSWVDVAGCEMEAILS